MPFSIRTPDPNTLAALADELASWHGDNVPIQLHPGDLGWYSGQGPEATAAAIRTWSHGGVCVAMGLLDGEDLLRLAVAPEYREDSSLAHVIAADLSDPAVKVLPEGSVSIEARDFPALTRYLQEQGWQLDELWTPLRLDLTQPIRDVGMFARLTQMNELEDWAAVHWSAFKGTGLTPKARERFTARLRAMMVSPFADRARMLTGFDDHGTAAAVAIAWSAGDNRPAVLEPMGVHQNHRGKGYGVAITRAAAAAMRSLGASSLIVATETARIGAVKTYEKACFIADAPVADLRRPA